MPSGSFAEEWKHKEKRAQTPSPLSPADHSTQVFPRYSPQKSHFATFYIASPGPGAYDPGASLSGVGKYYLTKYTDTQSRSFARAHKRDFLREKAGTVSADTPGPGTYEANYSEFASESPQPKAKKRSIHLLNRTVG